MSDVVGNPTWWLAILGVLGLLGGLIAALWKMMKGFILAELERANSRLSALERDTKEMKENQRRADADRSQLATKQDLREVRDALVGEFVRGFDILKSAGRQ